MSDKMREEFETAVALEAGEPVLAVFLSRRNDTYSTSTLHFAWWAWKQSRVALAVDLPEFWDCGAGGLVIGKDELIPALEAAGLKVKP